MHMDAGTVLELGAVMLALGAVGLFLVRRSNHRLRGLGWLGGAFACGFFAAFALVVPDSPAALHVVGSDVAVLLAFALLHVGVMELMTSRQLFPFSGMVLVTLMAVIDMLRLNGLVSGRFRMASVSLMVAIQCAVSARLLWGAARRAERGPAVFCSSLLSFFALYNVVRAGVAAAGLLAYPSWSAVFITGGYALYIAVALGVAFGFFWMSTAQLSVQLEHIAGIDPLTRLFNRRTFLKACEKELDYSVRRLRPFSILMIDLDHFKRINDRYGHAVGDAALVAAVTSMQDSIRGSDILARWGGEEFAALLPNASADSAHVVAERIRANVERAEIMLSTGGPEGKAAVRMTVSIGLATCDEPESIQSVMARADHNLYLAKNAGRNRVLSAKGQPPAAMPAAAQ
jgi:diguanylate cyclase (GGDEF)-like protein